MMKSIKTRILGVLVIGLCLLSSASKARGEEVADNEQCSIYGCCEQDCCGKGTSWNEAILICVDDPDSDGFNGSYSSTWEVDCALRVCCEQNCCAEGLEYDTKSALCIPGTCRDKTFQVDKPFYGDFTIDKAQVKEMYKCCLRYANVVLQRNWNGGVDAIELCPGNGLSKEESTYDFVLADNRTATFACPTKSGACNISGDGLLSDGPCHRNADCLSGNCYFPRCYDDDDDIGSCVCNDCADNEVCSDECTINRKAFDEYGGEECERCASRLPPSCYLKMGEACSPDTSCVTGHCVNGTCGCSPITHYPCDAETEACKFSKCEPRTLSCTPQGTAYKIVQYKVGMPTISLANVTNMYDCCQNLGDVSLDREWHANVTTIGSPPREYIPKRSDSRPIEICPGQGVSKEGDTYRFTRADGTVVVAKCSLKTDLCTLSGDGMASSTYCFRNENCRSDVCYVNPDSTYGFGDCDCKPGTLIGCQLASDIEDKICASPEMMLEITGTVWEFGRNYCFQKVGKPCNFDSACLTRNCDKRSPKFTDPPGVCACNPVTDYPCDIEGGEKCVISSGSYTCK